MKINLTEFNLFHDFPLDLLEKWESYFIPAHFQKRKPINFLRGFQDLIYFVHSGLVKVSYLSEDGKEFTVALLRPGDVYSQHSMAISTAMEESEILYVSMSDFQSMLKESPELSLRIIRVLGQILWATNEVIFDLVFREASARLAHILYREGQQRAHRSKTSFDFTHEEMASLSGTTRQTINEILNRWERQGMVKLSRGRITVLDWDLLESKIQT